MEHLQRQNAKELRQLAFLKQLAKDHDIKDYSEMSRSGLIKELRHIPGIKEELKKIIQRKNIPKPQPRKNIYNQSQKSNPTPKGINKNLKVGERIKFFESIKDPTNKNTPKQSKISKKSKAADKIKFYDSLTVTTNKNIPNKSQRPKQKPIIKTYKVADRKKFYESLKDLTNKNIIKPMKNTNSQTQKTTPDTSKEKAETNKRRPPTTLIVRPLKPTVTEARLNEREEQNPPNQNTHVVNADLNNDLSNMIFNELKPHIEMRSRIVYSFTARIHRGRGEIADYPAKTLRGEGTFTSLSEIEGYIERCETKRLDLEDVEAWMKAYLPATEVVETPGVYQGRVEFIEIQVKVIHSNEPLMGCGPLPDWLRNKKCIHAVDDKKDNLCVWRCFAIYFAYRDKKSRPAEDTTRKALKLARDFYDNQKLKTSEVRPTKLIDFEGIAKMFSVNIRLYEPKDQNVWKLVFGKDQFKPNLPCVDIGLYKGHCFFIKDIEMLTKLWECSGCQQRFNRHDNYNRHVTEKRCSGGKTQLICKGKKFKHIMNSSEKVFYGGNTQFSYDGCRWIEAQSKNIGKHIHHALCGHGGERFVKIGKKENLVDGYEPESKTVFQYYGCKWHGCPCSSNDKTRYNETIEMEQTIRSLGYNVVSVWEHEKPELSDMKLEKEFIPYEYFIVWDSEAIQHNLSQQRTADLTFINKHIPVSIAIDDNFTNKPTFLVNSNPEELVKDFISDLEHRQKTISEKIRKKYPMPDKDSIPKNVLEQYEKWCNQVPVLGFNSGKYDINMIKEYFVNSTTEQEGDIFVAKKDNRYMFLTTEHFKFLDVISYLAPGLSFDKWCKANNCKTQKLVFPYEWMDSYEKLSHVGPVKYEDFYSSLHQKITVSPQEYEKFKMEFQKRGCVTMMDWLREYNIHDVVPFKEALEKTREQYYPDKIDILKDAVSIPGISMTYVFNKAIEMRKRGEPELFAPGDPCHHKCDNTCRKKACKECCKVRKECTTCPKNKAKELLTTGMVGGRSDVFKRYAEKDKTKIRSHKYENPKPCKIIRGDDANSLYLYCSGQEMPCGKEKYIEAENPTDPEYVKKMCDDILTDKFLVFVKWISMSPKISKKNLKSFHPCPL